MKLKKTLLVTTALEKTWGKNEDILFLGEWCKLYDRKDVWGKRNSITLLDPWSNRERRFEAYQYTEKVFGNTIESLADALNNIHGVNYPIRYWKILCGPWLRIFINRTYHQWECISKAIESNRNLETLVIETEHSNQVPTDMIDFESRLPTDYWNHYIGSLIIDSIQGKVSSVVVKDEEFGLNYLNYFQKISVKRRLLSLFFKIAGYVFNRPGSVFISTPYLSKLNNIKLCLRLGVIPSITIPVQFYKHNELNKDFRVEMKLMKKHYSEYEMFLNKILLPQIPYIYVEGFKNLLQIVDRNKWTKNPTSIITAVDHFSNDIFKCYAANNAIRGSKINIICHGGGGKQKYSDFQSLDFNLCDNYFTWGWLEYSGKCTQGFFVKNPGYKRHANSNEENLLHVTLTTYRYQKFIDSSPSYEQFLGGYLNDQVKFLNELLEHVKVHAITKLHFDYQNAIESRINAKCSNVRYARMGDNFYELLRNAKLVVTTYNCTTPVESIAMNIPTIIFWNPEHWELTPTAIPFFNKLLACGVFHESPESAALKVNQIWDDVDGWWQSQEVQTACDEFRMWFGRESSSPINDLVNFCRM